MIPLSHWLSDQARGAVRESPVTVVADVQEPPQDIVAEGIGEQISPEVGRIEELLAGLAGAEERIAEQARLHAIREQELLLRLGEETRARLAAEIARAFDELLAILEEELSQVLRPFLSGEAQRRAVADLLTLVRRELQGAESAALEIRAPAALHEELSSLAGEAAVSITFTKSEAIEVVLAAQRLHFEELSARWCAAIQGRDA
jgi:hypothetical protein